MYLCILLLPLCESFVDLSFLVCLTGRLVAFRMVIVVSLFFLELTVMFFGILLHFALVGIT